MDVDRDWKVLVVDDDPFVLEAVSSLISSHGFTVVSCGNAREALGEVQEKKVVAVVTDINMPAVSGIELLDSIHGVDPGIPVILMTAYAELDTAIEAIKRGAFDFVTKPFKTPYLIHVLKKAVQYYSMLESEKRYRTMLEDTVALRTKELADALAEVRSMNIEIIRRLSAAAEFRDTDTGAHISRIGYYSKEIARALGKNQDFIDTITLAAPLHDIGKIAIPDNILLKAGKLTAQEFEVMKTHTTLGSHILADSSNPTIQFAASIALNHHERWNGQGYPRGLRSENIPLEGRIVMLADQYDALRSKRPYKPSLSHEETLRTIMEGTERTTPDHFDPMVLRAFTSVAPLFAEIFSSHQD